MQNGFHRVFGFIGDAVRPSVIAFLFTLSMSSSICNIAEAQVLAGFNTAGQLDGFVIADSAGGGTAVDSIYLTKDPINSRNGVLGIALGFNGPENGGIHRAGKIPAGGAQQLVYWVFLPSGIPDSVRLAVYATDDGNMVRHEVDYWAANIPRLVWYPLTFPLTEISITSSDFDIVDYDINDIGLEINNFHGSSTSWSGSVYVDSVSLLGAYPGVYADFSSGLQGFSELWPNGWVDSVSWIPGPIGGSTGAVRLKLVDGSGATGGVAFGIQPATGYRASTQSMIAFWIYVDSTFPDAAYIEPFAQDNNSWALPAARSITTYTGLDLPREKWYPVYFDMNVANALSNGVFDSQKYPLGKFGFQVGGPPWTGTVYVDRVEFISTTTPPPPPKWVAADFDDAALGLQGFYVPAANIGTLERILDASTGNGTYVMKADVDFARTPHIFSAVRNRVPLLDSADYYKFATKVSFDIYFPSDMPEHAVVQFYVSGGSEDSAAVTDTVDGAGLKAGAWNTLSINTDSLVQSGIINPAYTANVGVNVFYPYPYDTTAWNGSLYFDNLVYNGISRPAQITDAVDGPAGIPKRFRLYSNYPNPFNPTTVIRYDIPRTTKVSLRVYNTLGQEIATLIDRKLTAGEYQVQFDGSRLASGVYLYRLIAGPFVKTSKMVLLK